MEQREKIVGCRVISMWDEISPSASPRVEHILPVILLVIIFTIFFIACLFEWWRESHAVDLSIPPPSLTSHNITLTDGKTGEEKVLAQE
ncbi:hypothetical protein V3C99_007684 [Haemonchus contortus]